MRRLNVIKGDILFQWKYGFYFLYGLLVVIYLMVFSFFQGAVKDTVVTICVFSDPAAMGLFFMGAIILLERSQRITSAVTVSPISPHEYILGKVVSFAFISVVVGVILILNGTTASLLISAIGIMLSSVLFTLCGIIVGTHSSGLNQYIVATIPFEIVGFVPAVAYRAGWMKRETLMLLHPGCAAMEMIDGREGHLALSIVSLIAWCTLMYFFSYRSVKKMYGNVGERKDRG